MSIKKNILCFLPTVGDTKDSKRIEILKQAGFDITIVAFDRNSHKARIPSTGVNVIGKTEDGKYLLRILIMLKNIAKLRAFIKKCDAIYVLNQDLAVYTYISGLGIHKPLIIDIADIREIQTGSGLISKLFRLLDKFIAKRAAMIVVTAEGFISHYYKKILNIEIVDFILLENKVDYKVNISDRLKLISENKKIRIGYFGILRDEWTIEFLKELVNVHSGKYEIVLAGVDSMQNINLIDFCSITPGFKYVGPFKSPDDLDKLFTEIDLIAIFYPNIDAPLHWFEIKSVCKSNRFYEACYFKKPIISFSFCEDGKKVLNNDIGIVFNSYNIKEDINILDKELTIANYTRWKSNLWNLPEDDYCFINEYEIIQNKFNEILRIK